MNPARDAVIEGGIYCGREACLPMDGREFLYIYDSAILDEPLYPGWTP